MIFRFVSTVVPLFNTINRLNGHACLSSQLSLAHHFCFPDLPDAIALGHSSSPPLKMVLAQWLCKLNTFYGIVWILF